MTPSVSFLQNQDLVFKKVLHQRVADYFVQTGLSKHHTPAMIVKTIIMLALYIAPFILLLSISMPFWMALIIYIIMGVGVAGIGMSVMHDGNHYGYSANHKTNRLMGLTMSLLGADAYNWKIKHNKLHHVFTNIYNKDEDINSRVVLRFAYASPLRPYHKYQYIYAWFFYALMSLSMVFGDIPKRFTYRSKGITNIAPALFRRSIANLIIAKILYFSAIIGLPLFLTEMTWWQVLTGFLVMHMVTGTILSIIFQMAHVVEGPEQALPDGKGKINHSLLAHQLRATADFSKNNKLLSWYVGGLNFQVEHHLYPKICHVHYPAISEIVEQTTAEFNMPYYVFNSFGEAFRSHLRTLKDLGKRRIVA